MDNVKSELENNNIFDLHAVKVEVNEIKVEPPFELEWNYVRGNTAIQNAYSHAMETFLDCFYEIFWYYQQKNLINIATHQLKRVIGSFDAWYEMACFALHILEIPFDYQKPFRPRYTDGKYSRLKRSMQTAIEVANYFAQAIAPRDPRASSDLKLEVAKIKHIFNALKLDLEALRSVDEQVPLGRSVISYASPLVTMINEQFNAYYLLLFDFQPPAQPINQPANQPSNQPTNQLNNQYLQ